MKADPRVDAVGLVGQLMRMMLKQGRSMGRGVGRAAPNGVRREERAPCRAGGEPRPGGAVLGLKQGMSSNTGRGGQRTVGNYSCKESQ